MSVTASVPGLQPFFAKSKQRHQDVKVLCAQRRDKGLGASWLSVNTQDIHR